MLEPAIHSPYRCTVIGLPYSPWTDRATWALKLKQVPVKFIEYLPMLGEPLLRMASRRLSGPVTVPVLLHGDLVLTDSLDIIRYADRIGHGAPLFPLGSDGKVHHVWWQSQDLMAAGRIRTTHRVMKDGAAILENAPGNLPGRLRKVMQPVVLSGARYLLGKYGTSVGADDAALDAQMTRALLALRETLDGRDYFVGPTITAADLAAACALQFVAPLGPEHINLGKANARCWRDDRLAAEFDDLVAWRDHLVARHRTPRRQ